ncbi:MAG: DUF4900 domain-containing protein, partial [Candidatus Xenobia bacterium]
MVAVLFAAVGIVSANARAGAMDTESQELLYVLQSGIATACSQLGENPDWPSANGSASPNNGFLPFTITLPALSDGTVPTCQITIFQNVATNNLVNQVWKVTATAQIGIRSRTMTVWVQNESFSRFALFLDTTPPQQQPDGTGGEIFLSTGQTISGPLHTNGHWSFAGHPQFTDIVSSSNSDDQSDGVFNPTSGTYDTTKIPAPATGTSDLTNDHQFYHALGGNYTANGPQAAPGATNFNFIGGQPSIGLPTTQSIQFNTNSMQKITGDV